jgi:hypothetical protein
MAGMPWSPLRTYAIGVWAGLVGFQVQGLFITNMGWFLMWAMAAIPLCCALAPNKVPDDAYDRGTSCAD